MTNQPRQIGNYVLDHEIGRGGTSEVWLAHHAHLEQRQVAIKILTDQSREAVQRFNREANLAGRLNHPNIVRFYDHGYSSSFHYSVFEYIQGHSLRQLIEREKRLDLHDAVTIFKQVAVALDYAHSLNIVHRDISPGNVLLEQGSNRVLLTDFGIAREVDRTITMVHSIMGTPGYWSPEQTESATLVSHLSDIYSLGVVFYVMLSGVLPWDNVPGPHSRVFDPPLPLKQRGVDHLPNDIDLIMQTLLAVDPAKRFPSAGSAVEELERICMRHQVQTVMISQDHGAQQTDGAHTDGASVTAGLSVTMETSVVETVLSADLVRAPITAAQQRAKEFSRPAQITGLLDQWARESRFRRPLLGRLAQMQKIHSRCVYFYHVHVLYERREQPQELEEPDKETVVTQLEPEIDRWQVHLPPPQDFRNDPGAQVLLPGSTRVIDCRSCRGKGATVCPRCKGKQRIPLKRSAASDSRSAAPNPNAIAASMSGSIYSSSAAAHGDASAPLGASPMLPEQQLVSCPECKGRGGLTCERCEGVGRLIQRRAFSWRRVAEVFQGNDELVNVDEGKLTQICQAHEIYCEQASNGFRAEWGTIPVLRELIQEAQAVVDNNARIVLSEVTIRFIPVTDIVFDLGHPNPNAKDEGLYKLTIYGFENYIPSDWRFLNWERVIFLCMIGFMAILLIILSIFVWLG